jgi:anti-sigma B factor antagonist
VEGIPILDLAGRFLVGTDHDRSSLRTAIRRLVSEGRVHVLVHLSRLTDIDAHGLGELAWSTGTLWRCGGQLSLIAPHFRVRRLLALTRIETLLPIYDSESEALMSVPANRDSEALGVPAVAR